MLRDVAGEAPATVATLTVSDVNGYMEMIHGIRGKGSLRKRRELLGELMRKAIHEEQRFLVRLWMGDLGQGALEGVMTEAIATASGIDPARVRRAVMLSGDLAAVAGVALTDGEAGLSCFRLRVGTPVNPMLAQPVDTVADALATLGEAAIEYKMDGARVQVHRNGNEVAIFSRQLNEVGERLPEIAEAVLAIDCESIVLDGEVLAFDTNARPLPFQVTMRRFGRKLDIETARQELPLSVFFFDCLQLNGADLYECPARERYASLAAVLPGEFAIPRLVTGDSGEAAGFMKQALADGHEGVMVKSLDAAYEAGSRGADWLKIKPVHTLDLVVLAAEWGSGRRKGWLSNLHLGARDPDTGNYVMLGKTFKGLTDETLAWQTDRLLELETERDGHVVHVRPELVVEIAFNELQDSPHYPAGLALRFARVRHYREDKPASEADTLDTVRAIRAGGFSNQVPA